MLKMFKPDKKKIGFTVLLAVVLFFLTFIFSAAGFSMPMWLYYIVTVLQISVYIIPLLLVSPIQGLIFLVLYLLGMYLLSCVLILLTAKIRNLKWTRRNLIILGAVLLLCLVASCYHYLGWSDVFVPTADAGGATTQGVSEAVHGNNQFAVDLYSELSKDSDDNVFFSPWSISTAFAMAYEGARGETASEIKQVLHFPDEMRANYARMMNTINKAGGKYTLSTANAIWLQEDYPFLQGYKDIISRYYLGEIKNLDFVDNPVGSSAEINRWVAKHTNNKIKSIVSPSLFTPRTRAVLTNAIYFKGKWEHQFDKDDTKDEDFNLESGQTVKVPMMRLTDDDLKFNYAESDGIQILEMRYQGDKISMLVLLPRTEIPRSGYGMEDIKSQLSDMNQLQSMLSADKLQEWRNKLKPETVYIYTPKFTFETEYSLVDNLKAMGMNIPFEWPGADFSGMDGTQMLYIDEVMHKAYIDVYEEGTEAAAVTAIMMTYGKAMPRYIEFRADHPFMFVIQETGTGNILFMGRVNDPS